MLRLAIVVPTLNEEAALPRILSRVLALSPTPDEVVISDGGSTDRTAEIARALGAHVVTGPPGRGGQLTRGAEATTADVLLFLHADTELPADGLQRIREAIAQGAAGGGFSVRYDSPPPLLRLFGERLIDLRTRLTGWPLGDQAQFVTREAFRALGGYRDWPILEDLDFARRLRRYGRTVLITSPVTTAARRFQEQGVVRTVATNWLIWILFLCGVSPHRLARLYKHIR